MAAAEQLNLEDGAAEAIVSLSGGDMRKVLNILESCSLAYKDIHLDKIYEVTGRPSPNDVKIIFDALMKSTHSDALKILLTLKAEKSLSLDDLVREIHVQVMRVKMPDEMKMYLVNRLSEIEYRLAQGCNEKPQSGSLVGSFIEVRSSHA